MTYYVNSTQLNFIKNMVAGRLQTVNKQTNKMNDVKTQNKKIKCVESSGT